MEDRCQAYQNAILDHGLVVRGEETKEWRRGFDDPRFQTFVSTRVQTELTGNLKHYLHNITKIFRR